MALSSLAGLAPQISPPRRPFRRIRPVVDDTAPADVFYVLVFVKFRYLGEVNPSSPRRFPPDGIYDPPLGRSATAGGFAWGGCLGGPKYHFGGVYDSRSPLRIVRRGGRLVASGGRRKWPLRWVLR